MQKLPIALLLGSSVAIQKIPLVKNTQNDDFSQSSTQVKGNDFQHLQYLIPANLGTSGNTFYVIPDTTIRDTWVISGRCQSNVDLQCQTRCLAWGNRFQESLSKTYKSLAASSLIQTYQNVQLNSWLAQDNFKIGDINLTAKNWLEVEPTQLNFGFFQGGDASKAIGVLGLGFKNQTTFETSQIIAENTAGQRSFSMVLDEAGQNSYMTFGGYDNVTYKATDIHPLIAQQSWTIDIDYLRDKNGKLIKPAFNVDVDIDTFSPYITVPDDLYNKWTAGIGIDSGCTNQNSLPTLIFAMQGTEYKLESQHYVINTAATGNDCVWGIKSSGQNDTKIRFGLPFIRQQPLFFDLDKKSIAFLQKKTSQDIEQFLI